MSSSTVWKILIAEDEPIIMRGIETILTTNAGLSCEIVGRANNGMEAVELIRQHRPDIVVTDIKMPGMDGIELLHYIFENDTDICTVVLSGFNDYEYLRKAINYRTVDYVLKPVQPGELIESVRRAIERRLELKQDRSEKERLQSYANRWVRHVQDKVMDKLIHGEATFQEAEFVPWIDEAESVRFTFGLLQTREVTDHEAGLEVIRSIVKEHDGIAFFPTRHGEFALLFFHCSASDGNAAPAARKIKQEAETRLNMPVFIVLSSTYSNLEHLTTAYHQCKDACLMTYLDSGDLILADQLQFPSAQSKITLQTDIQDITAALRNESGEEALKGIDRLLGRAVQDRPSSQLLTFRLHYAFLDIWYRFKELCGEEELSALTRLIGKDMYTDWNQLVSDAHDFIQGILEAVRSYDTNKKQIQQAKLYIENKYDQNITLKEVADHVYLSPAYFSALFKAETGMNYVDYLNRVRVDRSKQLLQQTNEKIYAIAEKVGYRSMQHFGKIFKEFAGVTPSEYRELNFEK